MARPLRVLVISHSYLDPGNRPTIEAMRAIGIDARVLTPDAHPFPLHGNLRADRFEPWLEAIPAMSIGRSQFLLRTLDLGVRKWRPDIVHLEYPPWAPVTVQAMAVRLAAPRVRVVVTAKKNTYMARGAIRGLAKDALADVAVRRVDAFDFTSTLAHDLYASRWGPLRVPTSVGPQLGVDLTAFEPRERVAARIVGYAGRLDHQKGVMDLVHAVHSVREASGMDLEVHLLGTGPLQVALEDLGSHNPWLVLHAPVSHREVAQFMASIGVFVMPARVEPDHQEHDGQAVMEACASGLPCIATTSGVLPDLLADDAGILVPPADTGALAGALVRLLRDPELAAEIGSRARVRAVARFSVDAVARRRLALYRRVLA